MRRLARLLVRLYPAQWRQRYGDELEALLEDADLRWHDVIDLLKGALVMRLSDPRTIGRIGLAAGALLLVLGGATVLRSLPMFVIHGEAMAPALRDGDRVVGSRIASGEIGRGDIVAFRDPTDESKTHVKRVVALPGETVAISAGEVFVNDTPLDEPYVAVDNRSARDWGPYAIPEDHYFLLGDNRRNSMDSRHYGPVPRTHITAKITD